MTNVRKHRWLDGANAAFWWLFVVAAALGGLVIEVRGCEGDHRNARRVAEEAGYRDVVIGGPDRWSCGSELVSNAFTARGGVRGVVCCGLVARACVVRLQ